MEYYKQKYKRKKLTITAHKRHLHQKFYISIFNFNLTNE